MSFFLDDRCSFRCSKKTNCLWCVIFLGSTLVKKKNSAFSLAGNQQTDSTELLFSWVLVLSLCRPLCLWSQSTRHLTPPGTFLYALSCLLWTPEQWSRNIANPNRAACSSSNIWDFVHKKKSQLAQQPVSWPCECGCNRTVLLGCSLSSEAILTWGIKSIQGH